jgi:membrane-associated phospholipid phosphatase
MKRGIIDLIFILILYMTVSSVQSAEPLLTDSAKSMIDNQIEDLKYISSRSISNAKNPNWEFIAFSGLTVAFILGYDLEYHEDYGLEKEYGLMGIPRILGNIGTFYDKPGPTYFALGLTGAIYGGGLILQDNKLKQTAFMMAQSYLITGLITMALKAVIGRARPYVANDPYLYKPLNFDFNSHFSSMPSGHTSSIFSLMTVIAQQYNSWYVTLPAYTFALSVALQRMNTSKHWGSDLLIGGAIGYLVGSAVVSRGRQKEAILNIQPFVSGEGIGLAIIF